MSDPTLVPVFMPPLVTLLLHAERLKKSPLTQTELSAIRDSAICMMIHVDRALAMDESRGYRDLDPEQAWEEWQEARTRLAPSAPDETPDL